MTIKNFTLCIGLTTMTFQSAAATDILSALIVATPAAITKMGGPEAAEGKVYSEINNINQSFSQ